MSGRRIHSLADGQPIVGDLVGLVDESGHEARGGVYYVVGAAVVVQPAEVAGLLQALVAERTNVVHWAREGPAMRQRLLDLMCDSVAAARVLWSATGRTGQVVARAQLLTGIATWANGEGVEHLIIESSDERMNLRDRQTLAQHPLSDQGGLGSVYDHRSKNEPLLWIADAVAGAFGEHLIGKGSTAFEQLVRAGVLPPM